MLNQIYPMVKDTKIIVDCLFGEFDIEQTENTCKDISLLDEIILTLT